MITEELRSIAIKSLRQEQSLRDHGGAVEVVYTLNPKFPDLIPPPFSDRRMRLALSPRTKPRQDTAEVEWLGSMRGCPGGRARVNSRTGRAMAAS